MTSRSRTLGIVIVVIAVVASTLVAAAQNVEIPPFDWATAVWSDPDGGYCNPGGFCAAPRELIPPSFGQYCTTSWCSFPTWELGFELGLYGGLGGGGGGCDYSTDCFANMVGVIQPPLPANCPFLTWPICSILYGTPTPPPSPPGLTPTPESGECPLNLRVSQQPPTISANKIAPAYPLVVGQDPDKRGVDVSASIQVHPAVVKYDVPKYEHECQYVGGTVTDSACQNNPGWKIFVGCETKTLTYPDPIAFAVIDADLAAKYPGAHVYQAHWALCGRAARRRRAGCRRIRRICPCATTNCRWPTRGHTRCGFRAARRARPSRRHARCLSPRRLSMCICSNRASSDKVA